MGKNIVLGRDSFLPRSLTGVTLREEAIEEPEVQAVIPTNLPVIRNLEVSVLSQTVRDTADGGSVVDVIIELPASFDAENLDFRITAMGAI